MLICCLSMNPMGKCSFRASGATCSSGSWCLFISVHFNSTVFGLYARTRVWLDLVAPFAGEWHVISSTYYTNIVSFLMAITFWYHVTTLGAALLWWCQLLKDCSMKWAVSFCCPGLFFASRFSWNLTCFWSSSLLFLKNLLCLCCNSVLSRQCCEMVLLVLLTDM